MIRLTECSGRFASVAFAAFGDGSTSEFQIDLRRAPVCLSTGELIDFNGNPPAQVHLEGFAAFAADGTPSSLTATASMSGQRVKITLSGASPASPSIPANGGPGYMSGQLVFLYETS